MTAYAFTGPSRLTAAEEALAEETVGKLYSPTRIVTGGCKGWDMAVARHAIRVWPAIEHVIVCPAAPFAHEEVEALHRQHPALTVVQMLPSRDPYRARNTQMVAQADELVAGLRSPRFYRSGEWMTVNIARKAGSPVHLIDLTRA